MLEDSHPSTFTVCIHEEGPQFSFQLLSTNSDSLEPSKTLKDFLQLYIITEFQNCMWVNRTSCRQAEYNLLRFHTRPKPNLLTPAFCPQTLDLTDYFKHAVFLFLTSHTPTRTQNCSFLEELKAQF